MTGFDYPLLLEPIAVPKVWGGGKLAHIKGRTVHESGMPIGESWDVSTWPTAPDNPAEVTVTRITNGPLAGTPLDMIVDVPVVAKVIDSADRLSVQCHPTKMDVHKDEMWYILQADKGAYLYLDLAEGVDKEEFCALLKAENPNESTILEMMNKRAPLATGSHFNVPTGTVHAIGPGLLTFEISEETQITYRLYDYNRERSRGKLDLDEGCRAITTPRPNLPVLDHGLVISGENAMEIITEFPTFCVARVTGDKITVLSSKHMSLITATRGDIKISGPGMEWEVELWHTFTCLAPPVETPYEIDTMGSEEVLITPVR